MMRRSRRGFTLLELMVVVIIIGILAGVALPSMRRAIQRGRASEAEAGLGVIRSQMRTILVQTGSFPAIAAGAAATTVPGITADELNGHYYAAASYVFRAATTATTFCVSVTGNGPPRSMNEGGNLFENALACTGTVLNP